MMISFTKGDLFESNTDALVNTVNCEGYMGKGIAYQFKKRFPKNNDIYVKECKAGNFSIGKILVVKEDGKTIINFPTKDKWRKKSKYEYVERGMAELVEILPTLQVKSISFPPLGCGNGGLRWEDVKKIILRYLEEVSGEYDFVVFEPSNVINSQVVKNAPKLSASHLILMRIKLQLAKKNKLRLQKAAFLTNYFAQTEYFKFNAYNFGPFANSIAILSRQIKEYQDYYNFDTQEAIDKSYSTIISDSVLQKFQSFSQPLQHATHLVNEIETDFELELITTILFVLLQKHPKDLSEIADDISNWSERKAQIFSIEDIQRCLNYLEIKGLVQKSLIGYLPKR